MKRMTGFVAVMFVLGLTNRTTASDPTGIYAVIDTATIASSGSADETITLRGLFATAVGRRDYNPPLYGYLHFKLRKGKETVCRKEWADFQRVAGKGQCVAFASRHRPIGRIRRMNEKPSSPDVYPLNFGLRKLRLTSNYRPIANLAYCPRPTLPADGAALPAGKVTLEVANVSANAKLVNYVFELRDARGKTETSPAVASGKKKTAWTPKLQIERGGRYTWRAWVVRREDTEEGRNAKTWKGPVVTGQFTGARGR